MDLITGDFNVKPLFRICIILPVYFISSKTECLWSLWFYEESYILLEIEFTT